MQRAPAGKAPSIRLLLLTFDGANLLDISGPLQALQACDEQGVVRYDTVVASSRGGAIMTSARLPILTRRLDEFDPAEFDTVLVVGGSDGRHPIVPPELVDWVARAAPRVRRVCSVCAGAFILAGAGLLDGKRATTHWHWADLLQLEYPNVQVEPDSIYIDQGSVWTSAGVTAGIDMTLALIQQDYDHRVAIEAARRLVVFMKRPGGQAQFSVPLNSQSRSNTDFSDLHGWMRGNLAADLRVEALARRAGMSERTFARLYAARIGSTPARTVEAMRVEAACNLLETTRLSLKQVAVTTGFGDEQNLRRVFLRRFKLNPSDYRARFGADL